MRGRKPKPTALKLLDGNPGKRPIAADREPTPQAGRPIRPAWLDTPELRAAWDTIADRLEEMGVLTVADGAAMEVLTVTRTLYRAAVLELLDEGQTIRSFDKNGLSVLTKHPSVTTAGMWATTLNALFAKFGLTPSDRVRLVVDKAEASDPFEAFLRKQGQAAGRASKDKVVKKARA